MRGEATRSRAISATHAVPLARHADQMMRSACSDGISQPSFDWEVPRKPGTAADRDYTNLLALGELLLGYHNEYGLLTERPSVPANDKNAGLLPGGLHPPDRRDLGRNGSYLVFRQLAQDVPRFWRWVAEEANRVNVAPEELVAAGQRRVRHWSCS